MQENITSTSPSIATKVGKGTKEQYVLSNLFAAKGLEGQVLSQKPVSLLCKTARLQFRTFLQGNVGPYCQSVSTLYQDKGKQKIAVFISYSWPMKDRLSYEQDQRNVYYVKCIAKDLEAAGFAVLLDKWQDRLYQQSTNFIKKMLTEADYILVLASPLYLWKSEYRSDRGKAEKVVAYEVEILEYIDQYSTASRQKIVTALLEGEEKDTCLPPLLCRNNPLLFAKEDYFDNILRLAHDLYKIDNRDKQFEQLDKDFRGLLAGLERSALPELQATYEASQEHHRRETEAYNNKLAQSALAEVLQYVEDRKVYDPKQRVSTGKPGPMSLHRQSSLLTQVASQSSSPCYTNSVHTSEKKGKQKAEDREVVKEEERNDKFF